MLIKTYGSEYPDYKIKISGSGSGFDKSNILLSGSGFAPSGYPDFWIESGSNLG